MLNYSKCKNAEYGLNYPIYLRPNEHSVNFSFKMSSSKVRKVTENKYRKPKN